MGHITTVSNRDNGERFHYVQAFSYLRLNPVLCTTCKPKHVLQTLPPYFLFPCTDSINLQTSFYLSPPIFLKNFPCHGVKQATPCQLWHQGSSSSGRAYAPFLWTEIKPQIYSVTREWRFHFAESVPIPINESNLETQVMANPLSMCDASRLCLPLPYLRCQHTFSASSMVSPRVLCLCLPSPPWAY
jgi:hypothetical protein